MANCGGVDGEGTQAEGCPKNPATHAPDAQTTPHSPQLFASSAAFVQTPPQQRPSTTRLYPSCPTLPKRQATPDTPAGQLASTQEPTASGIVPLGHAPVPPSGGTHVPFTQLSPAGQAAPHVPQWAVLDSNPTTHSLEQQVPAPPSGSGHATPEFSGEHTVGAEHAPVVHVLVATHVFPQLPQLVWSVWRVVQYAPQQVPKAAVTVSPTKLS